MQVQTLASEDNPTKGTNYCHRALGTNEIVCAILDYLPLDDVCSFSETCCRMRTLCEDYFERRYFMKYLIIQQTAQNIILSPDQKYVSCFTQNIQNVIIRGRLSAEENLNLISKASSQISKHLKEIRFEYMRFGCEHSAIIRDHMEHIETIVFNSCEIIGNIYEILLKYCPKVKCISFARTNMGSDENNIWLDGDCPMLDTFHVEIRRKTDVIYWNRFFYQNPNVIRMKTVCLQGDHPIMRSMCRTVIQRGKQLKRLSLAFSEDFDYSAINEEFRDLDNKSTFEQLEMEFPGVHTEHFKRNVEKFTILKEFTCLNFDFIVMDIAFIRTLSLLPNIKKMFLVGFRTNNYVGHFKENFPNNLEKLYIGHNPEQTPIGLVISWFMRNSPKLKTVIFYSYAGNYVWHGLKKCLNQYEESRSKLKAKVNIYIHVHPKNYDPALHSTLRTNFVSIKVFPDANQYNFLAKNPLIQMTHPVF